METVNTLENVLCMKGGNGDSSYAYHSPSVQLKIVLALKPLLEHGIYQNVRSISKTVDGVFRIADFGCATGSNTLFTADTIVTAVKSIFIRDCLDVPEFQVHFADLPSNDFNTLFRSLPPFLGADIIVAVDGRTGHTSDAVAQDHNKPPATRCYFASAVSGSHYRRLFPRQTLHFCHSSTSLHWLSQVPASIEDRTSPAWNGGHVYISSDAVADAYLNQFKQDFAAFLGARAEEIIPGGYAFIAILARDSVDIKEQSGLGSCAFHLEAALKELVNEGLIEEEKLDSFNIPFYGPSLEELKIVVETENSFDIKSVRTLNGFPLHPLLEVREGEEEMFGRTVEKHYRALFENIVGAHLGWNEYLIDEFFSRIAKRASAKYVEYLPNTLDLVIAFLLRK
eukprot:PITA_33185